MQLPAPDYALECLRCGLRIERDRMNVQCPECGPAAFLRSDYGRAPLTLDGPVERFASYRAWLPFAMGLSLPPLGIACFRSEALARPLGLGELWLLVSGYAPELGAELPSCTFKTLEAAGVMLRVLDQSDRMLIISSAGNAGCAVLEIGSSNDIPAIVIVPDSARETLWVSAEPGARAPLLITLREASYPDAITMVGRMQARFADDLVREGGAFNVARRDSMGVPVLRAVHAIGRIPDHYVQAVGSGTGGIAAHEAALRLAQSGSFEGGPMRLHLAQNRPFTPMVEAFERGLDDVEPMDGAEVRRRLAQTYTRVLANAAPPYAVRGGVRDVLGQSGGAMYAVDNDAARRAHDAIADAHGFDPYPEGGAAFAALEQAVAAGRIAADETVLVHITGAGWQRAADDLGKRPYPVALNAARDDDTAVAATIEAYLKAQGSAEP
ncbi:MAG: cysteate synthase [Myxococcales bacterium]|nr:cysteate synthase [Myxococcales bacterium]